MKVLQITNKPPWPPVEGGPMAMHAMTNALLSIGLDVKVFAVSTQKCTTQPEDVPEEYLQKTDYETCVINTRVRWWQALWHLFTQKSYQIVRFFNHKYSSQLKQILSHNPPQIVLMESVFMWPYLKVIRQEAPHALVVLRAHNIEHRIWERIAQGERNPLKRWYFRHLTKRLAIEEIAAARAVDAIMPITAIDQLWFKQIAPDVPSMDLPFGLIAPDQPLQPKHQPPPVLFYHLGSMDWYPNLEAVRWLIAQYENGLAERCPMDIFHFAGRNMPHELIQKSQGNLNIIGEVSDSARFIADHHVLVAPLFSGSGIRIKILEAMALGKAVITTSVGAEGILCTHEKNILIANTTEEFSDAIAFVSADPEKISEIGAAASKLIREQYHPDMLAKKLKHFLDTLSIDEEGNKERPKSRN